MITHLEQSYSKIHISHFYNYVSAYEISEDEVNDLVRMLEDGLKEAKKYTRSVIVDKDRVDHIFVCHPSGNITLYREIGTFTPIVDGS